jgi:hypothetical protein
VTDVRPSVPPSSHPTSPSSKSTARGSSPDLSNLPTDLGLGLEIGPFTPKQGSLFPAQNKKLDISQEAQQHISTELVTGPILVRPAWITRLPSHKGRCSANEPRKGVRRLFEEVSVTDYSMQQTSRKANKVSRAIRRMSDDILVRL